SLEARVAYQYPKRKLTSSPTRQTRQEVRKRKEEQETSTSVESVEKKQPFKLSEIPSPVHGFRNQRREKEEVLPLTNIEKENKVSLVQEEKEPRFINEERISEKEEAPFTNREPVREKIVMEARSLLQDRPQVKDNTKESSRREHIEMKKTIENRTESGHHTLEDNSENRLEAHSNASKKRPLNVMMTPRDKHLLR